MSDPCVRGCVRARLHAADCGQSVCICQCHHQATHCTAGGCRENHDPDCRGCAPRDAEYGHLCWPCHRRMELMLTDMPTVDAWLRVHTARGSVTRAKRDWEQRQPSGDAAPSPISEAVLDHRGVIRDALAGLVTIMVEDHGYAGPGATDVTSTSRYLLAHLGTIEGYGWVDHAWTELAQVTSQAHALAPWRPPLRRLNGVPCPECHEAALVVYGGEEDVSCQSCRAMIPAQRYPLWTKMVAEGWAEVG